MILTGDIGGTKTRLAVFDEQEHSYVPQHEQVFQSSKYQSLEEIIKPYVIGHGLKVASACIGFAGPVKNGQALATNLPWVISQDTLRKCLNVRNVWIINDLEANAYGIDVLAPTDFHTLNAGVPDKHGNAGLISAGTGLGQAGLVFDGERLKPFATEGGHTDFAPKDEIQIELFRYLQPRYGNVSWERVLSGMGLFNIYSFLRDTGRGTDPDWLVSEILQGDSASCIAQAALSGKSELCDMALTMMVSFYGAEAGNLALKLMATGGIFLGGGIAPKIIERLTTPLFFKSFSAKGRFEKLMLEIPVQVILNDKAALLGAARYAYLNSERADTKEFKAETIIN